MMVLLVCMQHNPILIGCNTHILHMEMVLKLVRSWQFIRCIGKAQRLVLRRTQSMLGRLESRVRMNQCSHPNSSIELMGMAHRRGCRFQWIDHSSRDRLLGLHSSQSRQLEKVRSRRAFDFVDPSSSIVDKEMVHQ
jgi:hypothetical protein